MIAKLFKSIPWTFLLPAAILVALMPLKPEPHLFEKLRMLANGLLTRPLDIFDLFMHGTPLLLVLGKLFFEWRKANG